MKKSESKYFNTAFRMDQAFLELLGKKDMEYITVKEICETAGVNRSTFYLHYETIGDLMTESIQYMKDVYKRQGSVFVKGNKEATAFLLSPFVYLSEEMTI